MANYLKPMTYYFHHQISPSFYQSTNFNPFLPLVYLQIVYFIPHQYLVISTPATLSKPMPTTATLPYVICYCQPHFIQPSILHLINLFIYLFIYLLTKQPPSIVALHGLSNGIKKKKKKKSTSFVNEITREQELLIYCKSNLHPMPMKLHVFP